MDETPTYFDMPSSRTFDLLGVKFVRCKSTGYQQLRFTTVLTMSAAGDMLPPLVIFKNLKKAPKGNFPKGVVVTVASGGSMIQNIMATYRQELWNKQPGFLFTKKSILVMDAATTHTSKTVLSAFRRYSTTVPCIISGGLAPLVQPLDVRINRSFKSKLKVLYRKWHDEGEAEYAKSGKRKQASYAEVTRWVTEAAKSVDPEIIKKAFISCGLTMTRTENGLHKRLKDVLSSDQPTTAFDEEGSTGCTDTEGDDDYDEVEEDEREGE